MPLTVAVQVPAEDRAELIRWTRTPSLRAGLVPRAWIVLLADEGVGRNEIVERVGVSEQTVIVLKKRYALAGSPAWRIAPSRVDPRRSMRWGGARDAGAAGAPGPRLPSEYAKIKGAGLNIVADDGCGLSLPASSMSIMARFAVGQKRDTSGA
jgi:hypothetical protein